MNRGGTEIEKKKNTNKRQIHQTESDNLHHLGCFLPHWTVEPSGESAAARTPAVSTETDVTEIKKKKKKEGRKTDGSLYVSVV